MGELHAEEAKVDSLNTAKAKIERRIEEVILYFFLFRGNGNEVKVHSL